MKNDPNRPAVPFFARYLEGQDPVSAAGGTVETKKYPSDEEDEGNEQTKKAPSDEEDESGNQTLKHPSDEEDEGKG
jgi:hypothetical protein